ncbi:MAG: hypothetical protein BGO78_06730 [Chloroflexi bacterium 44-23]|nr:MAG: hypothetical protein BGO78_06730 [Chloroflexi bacterium 44-23]
MKKLIRSFLFSILILIFALGTIASPVVFAQEGTTTPIVTLTPTPTATSTSTTVATLTPTPTMTVFGRPLVVIYAYDYGQSAVNPGSDFTLKIRLKNAGGSDVYNLIASFASSDFLPLETGAVRVVPYLDTDAATDISQPLRANATLWGLASGLVTMNVSYTDFQGTSYSEVFTLAINLTQPVYSSAATATPTSQARAQLVVGGYEVDVNPLQPGSIFNLKVLMRNLGTVEAQGVTMVLGGGVSGSDGSGTPTVGGLSGGSSDLSTFAPLGSSNLIYLDKIAAAESKSTEVQLIVNVSTIPGAYPFKISFAYTNSKGERVVDDQVITLLVYSLPRVELGFYRDPGILFAGQVSPLPIQITNLGKTTAILGNLRVSVTGGADLSENVALVGPLEQGGYFTLDAMVMPYQTGPLDILVSVSYNDDFNQPRTVEQTLSVQVEPEQIFEPMPGDGTDLPVIETQETFAEKVVRFLKGLLGLGSAKSEPALDYPMPADGGEFPQQEVPVVPIKPGGKG